MKSSRAVSWALRLYPGWWKERYADEVLAISDDLMSDGKAAVWVALNLLRGAVAARTDARGMPRSYKLWTTRTRVSIATSTLPWMVLAPLALFALAGGGLHSSSGIVYWSGFSLFPTNSFIERGANQVPAPDLTPVGPVVEWSAVAMFLLVLVTFIVLVYGWTQFSGGVARTSSPSRRKLRLMARAPVISVLVDIALFVAWAIVTPHSFHWNGGGPMIPTDGHPAVAHVLIDTLHVVAWAGWAISIICVAVAAKRADLEPADLRCGRSVAITVATLFTLMAVACVTWSVGLLIQSRQAVGGNFTTVTYLHPGALLPTALALVAGAVLSILGARAARSSWRVVSVAFE